MAGVKLSHNILNLNFICRINKVEATEEQMLSIAPSRNRVVYRFRVPFLGTFLGKQKGTLVTSIKNLIAQ